MAATAPPSRLLIRAADREPEQLIARLVLARSQVKHHVNQREREQELSEHGGNDEYPRLLTIRKRRHG